MWHTYLVRCSDGSLYCGATNDLARRIERHNAGKGSKCVRGLLPVVLAWSRMCEDKSAAMRLEYRIKKLPKRAKEELVAGTRVV